jgi:hypothetical protein
MVAVATRLNRVAADKSLSERFFLEPRAWKASLKDNGSKWKKLENQKLSFVTFVVAIFYFYERELLV